MATALALAVWLAPSPSAFVSGLSSRDMWAGLNERMLPKESWFGLVKVPSYIAATPPASDITTGAIPAAPTQKEAPKTTP
jgi:hypothetical protein